MVRKNKKKVLLTGASRGIGQAIKELLEKEGQYSLITPTRQDLDLSDKASIKEYLVQVKEVDILINNAGIGKPTPILDITDEYTKNILAINLEAPLILIKHVTPYMIKKKEGKIVNISSIGGLTGSRADCHLYSVSKFALNGLTRSLARELAKHNILINAVCPSVTKTEMIKDAPDGVIESLMKQTPLQRLAEPVEIARLVKFLVGSDNTYITGQCIAIDGGITA